MKTVIHRLSKVKLKTFKVSFSPTYTNFVPNYIASSPTHPLNITQKRRQELHKKEGLWFHATNGVDLSKSACVRTWARRRLRQVFVEELKHRGYDKTGRLVDAKAMQERRDVMNVVKLGRNIDLTGSLRIHGEKPLVPASFEVVKEEMRSVVGALVQGAVDAALGLAGERERRGGPQREGREHFPLPPRRAPWKMQADMPTTPRKKQFSMRGQRG